MGLKSDGRKSSNIYIFITYYTELFKHPSPSVEDKNKQIVRLNFSCVYFSSQNFNEMSAFG